jgi:hypothetical protein
MTIYLNNICLFCFSVHFWVNIQLIKKNSKRGAVVRNILLKTLVVSERWNEEPLYSNLKVEVRNCHSHSDSTQLPNRLSDQQRWHERGNNRHFVNKMGLKKYPFTPRFLLRSVKLFFFVSIVHGWRTASIYNTCVLGIHDADDCSCRPFRVHKTWWIRTMYYRHDECSTHAFVRVDLCLICTQQSLITPTYGRASQENLFRRREQLPASFPAILLCLWTQYVEGEE